MTDPKIMKKLEAGLYMVATPIGNARDITLRALDCLRDCDVIAAEDTRTARKLMDLHGIGVNGRRMIAYHEHSGAAERAGVIKLCAGGASVAYVSEAGTPLIADPGFQLLKEAVSEGVYVTALPGASAVLTGLAVAGLPTDRFFFAGFLPNQEKARQKELQSMADIEATLVLYESPRRVEALLRDAIAMLGGERPAALARELTKKFEEYRRGSLADLLLEVSEKPPRGECVVMIGKGEKKVADAQDIDRNLILLMQEHRVKEAAAILAETTGLARRDLYQRALALKEEQNDSTG